MLRQAENKVKIEGILSEIDLKYGSFVKNGEPTETVGGTIKVLVEQEINKVPTTLEIPVYMFSTKYTRAGKINPSYESIETIMKEFVSIAACGDKDKADRVRITSGQIKMNEFIGQNGTMVSSPRVHASFVSRVVGTLSNPNVINAIENYWESGMCYRASGRLNFSSSTQTVLEEVDFGEPIEKVRTINVSEFLITGGAQAPLEEENAFSVEDIRKAMAERKDRLEAMKTNNVQKQAPAPTSKKGKLDLGF